MAWISRPFDVNDEAIKSLRVSPAHISLQSV
jgi:hypothetical protein